MVLEDQFEMETATGEAMDEWERGSRLPIEPVETQTGEEVVMKS